MKKLRLLFYYLLVMFPLSYGKAAEFYPVKIYYAEYGWNSQLELYGCCYSKWRLLWCLLP